MKHLCSLLLATLLGVTVTHAQPLVDCNCLRGLHELHVTACQDVIPDVCALVGPCLLVPQPLQCSQTPPPGGSVGPGNYPITVTFVDPFNNVTQACALTFTVTPPGTGCACITPPTGMVGWWPLDETCGAPIFADLSGSGNAAIVQSGGPVCSGGSPNAVAGKVAGANYFYGPTVQGRAPNAPSLNFGTTNSFSIDCWVNPIPIFGSRQPIVDKLNRTNTQGYALCISNGLVELRLGDGSLYTHLGPPVTFNVWNFVAVAVNRTANTVRFYVNGVPAASQPLAPAGSFNSTVDLLIGGSHALNDSYGEVALDEIELFNRVLTTNEMNAIWLADQSGKCKIQFPCTNSTVSIFCPPNTNVQTCTTSAIVFYPPPVASTSCGTITNLVCTPPSGSSFPLGTNIVTCIATDSQGNSAFCTFKVIVTGDRTPPSCPPISMSITGCPPRMPNFATNGLITDNCTPVGLITIVQSPLPGTVLPPGVTLATITACDAATNCVVCPVSITAVYSGTPPVITCPTNIFATSYFNCAPGGISVGYPLPQVSNGTLVSCTPPSGSFFPNGLTTVTCVATNICGTNQCTFTVTVSQLGLQPPCAQPPSNMVMWLKFDETTGPTAFNNSAGNNGVLFNGPTRTLGQYVKNSLCFNGVNQYVQVAPYAAMQFGTNDFTVDAWVKPSTLSNSNRVIVDHREENGPVTRGYKVFLSTNNLLSFQIADGTLVNYSSTLTVPADGQWHFVAVTVKRNNTQGIRFYVDGVQDSVPRDPTGHPGSVTAGPCFPFRVGSRSAAVSELFPGCIDEVELFRRALTAAELKTIYDARCIGKCLISCQPGGGQILQCWVGGFTNVLVINNPLNVTQVFNWSLQPLPVGPGCNRPGPIFAPSSGTVTNLPLNPTIIFTGVTLPPNFLPGDCSCYRMTISLPDGSQSVTCDGSICLPSGHLGGICVAPVTPLGTATNLNPGTINFTMQGTGPSPTTISNAHVVLRSPDDEVLSVTPLPTLTVPADGGGQITVPATFAFPEYDPGRFYKLQIEADLAGLGIYEVLSYVPVINVIPNTDPPLELSIRRGLGGTIIIIWPNPCATLKDTSGIGGTSIIWNTVTNAPIINSGGLMEVTLPPENPMKFYRLEIAH